MNFAKFNNYTKLEMPVKMRPQKRITAATSEFPALTSLTIVLFMHKIFTWQYFVQITWYDA